MVSYAFNPSTGRQKQVISEFKANLVYSMRSRTAKTVSQKNPASKTNQTNKQAKKDGNVGAMRTGQGSISTEQVRGQQKTKL